MSTDGLAPPPAPAADDGGERRLVQRFFALNRGRQCFWLSSAGLKIPLHDLSCQGFSCPVPVPPAPGALFAFTLKREAVPDRICGQAEVMNYIAGKQQVGCRFVRFEGDGAERLRDWLVAHVLMNASVPISEKDAEQIVSGRSMV